VEKEKKERKKRKKFRGAMAKAELGWRHLTKSGAHACQQWERYMPALHTWRNQEDVSYQPLPHADCTRQLFRQIECGNAEGRDVSGGEKKRRPTNTIYSARRDVDEQLIIVG